MLDIILRVLLGFLIFGIVGWISILLFGPLTGLVNGVAYLLAKGVRRVFGINGTWDLGTSLAATGIGLGKLAVGFCFFAALFLYSFLYPTLSNIAEFFTVATFVALLTIWMPSVFLLGLFGSHLREV
jgi:hypothetical protein